MRVDAVAEVTGNTNNRKKDLGHLGRRHVRVKGACICGSSSGSVEETRWSWPIPRECTGS